LKETEEKREKKEEERKALAKQMHDEKMGVLKDLINLMRN